MTITKEHLFSWWVDRILTPELLGPDRSFEYRLVSPLFDHQGMIVSAVPDAGAIGTSVRDRYGRPTARGTLR